ncbi:hypothetical protein GTP45_01260 [Pseudoduganella sp. FT55W]|uniref:Uncharacterized protein n=1 Tax=Duganella rivi TaxID=2666083 RepID=A0A7X4GLZ8_9BURK|nr:hypothetical protein [Duganella rivi]MYM65461.1 hypothetical protein [Duganella rivi]
MPMVTETHRRLALELRLACEALIGAPSPETYNTLSKMLAALKRAGMTAPALADATDTMNLIVDRYERAGKVGLSGDDMVALRRAIASIDGAMARIPVNLLDEAIVAVEVFCANAGA